MPTLEIKTLIKADLKTCFDLSRNIDFHQESLEHSKEKAIAGKISGLIELGEWVTWEATHFGVKQNLTSKITEFKSPTYFVDELVSGAFKSFKHEHIFETSYDNKFDVDYTIMTDRFTFKSPLGLLGKLADVLFLKRYMTNLLVTRNIVLKQKAEELFSI
ncbi:SRPBCC family protein [Winogradskyella sp. UBA3174]|uniref:SRPBCC family protein n=1 Tax=Winogradskyella sp. UBA3174 TaxID=1947785 RepID=UPI0025F2D952|nr:SRPBCC family protein [Winogradskyella sp. UBA3174]|tara:strand:+ start:23174 stop:23653 length:480 start_codon:yes stop_codon:yes gene_type:complete